MKLYKSIICAVAGLVLVGCKGFLDKTPLVNMAAETYYSSEAELNTAAIGIYSYMQRENFQIGHYLIIGDGCSDDSDLGNDRSEAYSWLGGAAKACQDFSVPLNNGQAGQMWGLAWPMINAATQLVEKGKDSGLNNADWYVGEAHFLRAFAYFNLITQYGGMPIVDHILQYSEYYDPAIAARKSAAETWAFIEKDLKAAAEKVPAKWGSENTGRITKGAALSLLAKSYIYQAKWQEAYDTIKSIETANYYSLEPVFEHIFDLQHQNGQECIFAIQHCISGTGWSDANEGSILIFYEHDAGLSEADIASGNFPGEKVYEKYQVGWSMHCPTMDLINAFEPGDPRLDATVIKPKEVFDGHIHYNLSSDNGYQSKKYYVKFDERSKDDQSDHNKNIIIIRYADILLFMAEACNELGKSDEALKYLEMVRGRARSNSTDPSVLPAVTTTNKEELRNAIWHERRVELAMEYQRFYDLARQGRVGDVMINFYNKYKEDDGSGKKGTIKGKNFVKGKNELWPINPSRITASKDILTQNPGY